VTPIVAVAPWFQLANRLEMLVWLGVALGLAWLTWRRRVPRWPGGLGAAVLVAFGASDLVEADTGAWWTPWWLLLWKAGCIAMLVALFWWGCAVQRRGGG
jgi:hypothetical protein